MINRISKTQGISGYKKVNIENDEYSFQTLVYNINIPNIKPRSK